MTDFIRAVLSFLRQAGLGTELTKITTPALFCLPDSTCSIFHQRFEGFEEFRRITSYKDPLDRFLTVLWFYLCIDFDKHFIFGKKPLNSILGESYICESSAGVRLIAEQVSHHPPVTAFVFEDVVDHRFQFKGAVEASASFGGNSVTVTTSGMGSFKLWLDDAEVPDDPDAEKKEELYVARPNLPLITAKGIILGTKRMEFNGEVELRCENSGIRAVMKFSDKKAIAITVYENDSPVMKIQGKLKDKLTFKAGGKRKGHRPPFASGNFFINWASDVAPMETDEFVLKEQCGKNSSAVWGDVTKAIKEGDFAAADYSKNEVEVAQREYIGALAATGDEHEYFFMDPVPREDGEKEFNLNKCGRKIMNEAAWFGVGRKEGEKKKKSSKKRTPRNKEKKTPRGSKKEKTPRAKKESSDE